MRRLIVLFIIFTCAAACKGRHDHCDCYYDAWGYWSCDCYDYCDQCGAYVCDHCGQVVPPEPPPPANDVVTCDLQAAFEIGYDLGYADGRNFGHCFGAPEADLGDFRCNTEYLRGYHVGCADGINDREKEGAP